MQFASTPRDTSPIDIEHAQAIFNSLMTELAIRDTNFHIGSYHGGNNFQMLVLSGMDHILLKFTTGTKIFVVENTIYWDILFLLSSPMGDIRKELDRVFPEIVENNKLTALAIKSILDNKNEFVKSFDAVQNNFPKIAQVMQGASWDNIPKLSPHEQIIMSCLLCAKLSEELDRGNNNSVRHVTDILLQFSPEVILISVRNYIGVERIVKFNLDDREDFFKLIKKVTQHTLSESST